MTGGDELTEIESTFAEVAVALFAPGTIQGTLDQIVQLAVLAIDGCQDAGVLADDAHGTPATVAASSPLVVTIHQVQIDAGEGPCLAAARRGTTISISDVADDDRWPEFAGAADRAGIRSVLAHAVSAEAPAALNLYARLPDAFGPGDRAQALLFATLARLALDSAKERALDVERTTNLAEALRTRELIGQAQGILIERERITGEEAFVVLRQASQHLNVKLREVAAALVETGERPDVGSGDRPAAD